MTETSIDTLTIVFQEYLTKNAPTLDLAVALSLKEIFETCVYGSELPKRSQMSAEEKLDMAIKTIKKLVRKEAIKSILDLFYSHRIIDTDISIGLDLALIAMRLRAQLDSHANPTILFLGRTPDLIKKFLVRDYELFPERKDSKPRILHAAFSGTPDVENIRTSAYYAHPDNQKSIIARNIVTEPKLIFYMHYLEILGLHNVQGPLIIVDLISTGSSMNAFLKLLYAFYQDFMELPLPNIIIDVLLPECPPVKNQDLDSPFFYDFEKETLHFNGDNNSGLWDMDVPAKFFQTSETSMELLLDYCPFQTIGADVPEFPAQTWTVEGSNALKRGGFFHKEVHEEIKPEIDLYLKQAHKEFQQFKLNRLMRKTMHNP